jgi:hypothetical protein
MVCKSSAPQLCQVGFRNSGPRLSVEFLSPYCLSLMAYLGHVVCSTCITLGFRLKGLIFHGDDHDATGQAQLGKDISSLCLLSDCQYSNVPWASPMVKFRLNGWGYSIYPPRGYGEGERKPPFLPSEAVA